MDKKGLKTGGGAGQPNEKKKKINGLVGAKNRGRTDQPWKKVKTKGLEGAETGGGAGQP